MALARTVIAGIVAAIPIAHAHAQGGYPARPVRIIVPLAPGGNVDIVARTLAQKLTEQLGGSFLVENRPGGTGIVATELVARSAPDGHTLLISATEFGINPAVRPKLPYDPFRDFTYISQLASVQFMLVSHPSVRVVTVGNCPTQMLHCCVPPSSSPQGYRFSGRPPREAHSHSASVGSLRPDQAQ